MPAGAQVSRMLLAGGRARIDRSRPSVCLFIDLTGEPAPLLQALIPVNHIQEFIKSFQGIFLKL